MEFGAFVLVFAILFIIAFVATLILLIKLINTWYKDGFDYHHMFTTIFLSLCLLCKFPPFTGQHEAF